MIKTKNSHLWLISSHTHTASPGSPDYFSGPVIGLAVHEGPNGIPQLSRGV